MQETIEVSFEQNGSTIDCRLEPVTDDNGLFYTVTILYATPVNGFPRSEIFCYDMVKDKNTSAFQFRMNDDGIHPKILAIESKLAEVIDKAQ